MTTSSRIRSTLDEASSRKAISEFQYKVYSKLLEVKPGKVTTYKKLGEAVGCQSAQAIGQVLKKNPFAPDVPCHRVVRSNLSLGGFSGSVDDVEVARKIKLLEEEGVEFDLDSSKSSSLVDSIFIRKWCEIDLVLSCT